MNIKKNNKRKGGPRPIVLTEEDKEIIERMAAGSTLQQISERLGISARTLSRIKDKDESVMSVYKKGKVKGLDTALGYLFEQMKNGNAASTIFYLKTQWKWKEPKDAQDVNFNVNNGKKKIIEVVIKENENKVPNDLKDHP